MDKNQLLQHKDGIIGCLAWFGSRGRRLGSDELSRLLYKDQATPGEIEGELKQIKGVTKYPDQSYGLAFLNQKPSQTDYGQKWRIARRAAAILRFVPYIRLVAVVNSVADQTARPDSDIDFFIVTAKNRLFSVRLLATGLLAVFGLRRFGLTINNHICLSFFVSEEVLDLEPIAIPGEDVYLAYWVAQAVPLIDEAGTYQKFLKANRWVGKIVPKYDQGSDATVGLAWPARACERVRIKWLADLKENWLAKWQLKRINRHPQPTDPDVRLVVDRTMLKFHQIDRRRIYREKWLKTIESYKKITRNVD